VSVLLAVLEPKSERSCDTTDDRLSSLGYEVGQRILSLILLRNTQAAGGKVSSACFV